MFEEYHRVCSKTTFCKSNLQKALFIVLVCMGNMTVYLFVYYMHAYNLWKSEEAIRFPYSFKEL